MGNPIYDLQLPGLLNKSVLSTDATGLLGGNDILSFDLVNRRVGIGVASPTNVLNVVGGFDAEGFITRTSYTGFPTSLCVGAGVWGTGGGVFSGLPSPQNVLGAALIFKTGATDDWGLIVRGGYHNWDCFGDWEQHGAMRGYPLITAGRPPVLLFRGEDAVHSPLWGEITFSGADECFYFSHPFGALSIKEGGHATMGVVELDTSQETRVETTAVTENSRIFLMYQDVEYDGDPDDLGMLYVASREVGESFVIHGGGPNYNFHAAWLIIEPA